jgi:hypothetical protein
MLRFVIGMVLAVAAAMTPGAICLAKPPDLPADITQHCPTGREGEHAQGFSARPQRQADRQQVQRGREHIVARPAWPQEEQAPLTPREIQARHLFDIAEHCRRLGDVAKARTCYEETHLLCPDSAWGRSAIDRLRALDRARMPLDAGEEQEAPPERIRQRDVNPPRRDSTLPTRRERSQRPVSDDDARRREMLRTTQPLGTPPEYPEI